MLIYYDINTICKFSVSPLSSYKMTLRQQLNGEKTMKIAFFIFFHCVAVV